MMKREKYLLYLPYVVTVICTAIYISLIFNDNLWMDEAFSASIIRCGFDEMVSRTVADTLPPFYNATAWAFTQAFGFSAFTLKLYSVIPMSLLMLITAYFLPRISSARAACIYIILITAMPYFLEHGVEIRMYSWATFFASASAIFALCVLKKEPRSWLYLVICTVLGAYTHQYALIAEAFIWLMLLVVALKNKKIKPWPYGAAACVILYIPCALLTIRQMKAATSYFSASPVTLAGLMSSIRYPFVTHFTPLSTLLMLSVIALLASALRRKEYVAAYFIAIYLFVTLMTFVLMLVTGSTFFSSRYLLPSIGMLWLGASMALDGVIEHANATDNVSDSRSGNKKNLPLHLTRVRLISTAAIVIVAATFLAIYSREWKAEYVDDSEFKEFISSTKAGDGYVMYEDFPEIEICLEYYAPWLVRYDMETIGDVSGDKYVFVNGAVHMDDVERIKSENFDLAYKGIYIFDRYNFKAYTLER